MKQTVRRSARLQLRHLREMAVPDPVSPPNKDSLHPLSPAVSPLALPEPLLEPATAPSPTAEDLASSDDASLYKNTIAKEVEAGLPSIPTQLLELQAANSELLTLVSLLKNDRDELNEVREKLRISETERERLQKALGMIDSSHLDEQPDVRVDSGVESGTNTGKDIAAFTERKRSQSKRVEGDKLENSNCRQVEHAAITSISPVDKRKNSQDDNAPHGILVCNQRDNFTNDSPMELVPVQKFDDNLYIPRNTLEYDQQANFTNDGPTEVEPVQKSADNHFIPRKTLEYNGQANITNASPTDAAPVQKFAGDPYMRHDTLVPGSRSYQPGVKKRRKLTKDKAQLFKVWLRGIADGSRGLDGRDSRFVRALVRGGCPSKSSKWSVTQLIFETIIEETAADFFKAQRILDMLFSSGASFCAMKLFETLRDTIFEYDSDISRASLAFRTLLQGMEAGVWWLEGIALVAKLAISQHSLDRGFCRSVLRTNKSLLTSLLESHLSADVFSTIIFPSLLAVVYHSVDEDNVVSDSNKDIYGNNFTDTDTLLQRCNNIRNAVLGSEGQEAIKSGILALTLECCIHSVVTCYDVILMKGLWQYVKPGICEDESLEKLLTLVGAVGSIVSKDSSDSLRLASNYIISKLIGIATGRDISPRIRGASINASVSIRKVCANEFQEDPCIAASLQAWKSDSNSKEDIPFLETGVVQYLQSRKYFPGEYT